MKNTLKFLALLAVVALISFAISVFVSKKRNAATVIPRFNEPTEYKAAGKGSQRISSQEASFSFLVAAKNEIRYYSPRSGEIKAINLLKPTAAALIATIKPSATALTWSPDGNEVIATYSTGRIATNLATGASKTLAKTIYHPQFANASDDVAYVYFNDASGEGNISVGDAQFGAFKNILKTRLKDWEIQWNSERRLSLIATSPVTSLQTLFTLDTKDQSLTSLAENQRDLEVHWSPDGTKALISHWTRLGTKLFLLNPLDQSQTDLKLTGSAGKCAWGSDNVVLYCASAGKDGDSFININTTDGTQGKLYDAVSSGFVDAREMIYSAAAQSLIFKNFKDGRLYMLSISH